MTVSSLSSYLRHHAQLDQYQVNPRIDLICQQAYALAEMNAQPLHALHLLKAMLHVPDHDVDQLLVQQGLILEKLHSTPLSPLEPPFSLEQVFETMLAHSQTRAHIGLEQLLLALIEDERLHPYFAIWRIDPEAIRTAALAAAL